MCAFKNAISPGYGLLEFLKFKNRARSVPLLFPCVFKGVAFNSWLEIQSVAFFAVKLLLLCVWECLIINKKHFLATQNAKCGHPVKIRKCGLGTKLLGIQLSFS